MKAAVIDRLGAAPRAVVYPDPPPATGNQVLVKVEAAALNAVDLKLSSHDAISLNTRRPPKRMAVSA